jgi:hypothetical protein
VPFVSGLCIASDNSRVATPSVHFIPRILQPLDALLLLLAVFAKVEVGFTESLNLVEQMLIVFVFTHGLASFAFNSFMMSHNPIIITMLASGFSI